jgi:hypothetical protein
MARRGSGTAQSGCYRPGAVDQQPVGLRPMTPDTTLAPLTAQARDYARQANAANTRRAYRAAWADFAAGAPRTDSSRCRPLRRWSGLYLAERAATSAPAPPSACQFARPSPNNWTMPRQYIGACD